MPIPIELKKESTATRRVYEYAMNTESAIEARNPLSTGNGGRMRADVLLKRNTPLQVIAGEVYAD